MPSTEYVSVLLVDDSLDFRAGLASLLAATCDVVGTLDDGDGIEDAVERLCPDVVVLDISMPNVDGFEAARRLLTACPDAKIVFLTNHTEPAYKDEARAIGAQGFVDKARIAKELVPAIRAVRGDETFFPDTAVDAPQRAV
jgi:DNA-binding NarL/FixJ family response regulator